MLVALNRPDEFKLHVRAALGNGVSREEIGEILLQTAVFAAGCFGGVVKEADGTKTVEYAVQIKKSVRGADLADALHAKSQILDVDIK